MYGCGISDLSALAGLTNLTDIAARGKCRDQSRAAVRAVQPANALAPVQLSPARPDPAVRLDQPNNFSAQDDGETNVAPLAGLSQLGALSLGGNDIVSLNALSGLINLNTLDLSGNEIYRLDALDNLTSLNTLYLNGNLIANIDPLTNMFNLQTVDVSYNTLYLAGGSAASNVVYTLMSLGVNIIILSRKITVPILNGQPSDLSLIGGQTRRVHRGGGLHQSAGHLLSMVFKRHSQ